MRVVHVIDSGGLYGAEAVVLDLARELMRLGHWQVLVSLGRRDCTEKPIEREARKRGIHVRPVRLRKGFDLLGSLRLARLVREERADLVHLHGYKPDILFGVLPRRLRGRPTVATVHGMTYVGGFDRRALYGWLDRRSLRGFDATVLVHGRLAEQVGSKAGGRWAPIVIENGISLDERPEPRGGRDRAVVAFCRKPVVGAFGRLSPEKGFDCLLHAVLLLAKRGLPVRLVLVGEGRERGRLEALVTELGLGEQVMMPGFLADARAYLPLFDALVLPSLTEGLPITLLEGMAARVPIVATRVGGVPDLLDNGKAGVLVRSGDAEALATGIESAISDPERTTRQVRYAYERVAGTYTTERMALRYLQLYCRLLDPVPQD